MNKRIRTDPHCFISIVGPCGSGKTQLVSNMFKNQSKIFQTCFDKIVYLYNHYQKHFDTLLVHCVSQKHSIEFHQGLNWSAVEKCEARKQSTCGDWRFASTSLRRWILSKLGNCGKTSKYSFDCTEAQSFSAIKAFKNKRIECYTDDFAQELPWRGTDRCARPTDGRSTTTNRRI